MPSDSPAYDLVCLSHLRWDFVFQRPQHLLSRSAAERRTFFFEEPVWDVQAGGEPRLDITQPDGPASRLYRAVPHILAGDPDSWSTLRVLLHKMMREYAVERYVLWYYTPMALPFSDDLHPLAIVFDVMDQLSAFRGAPPELLEQEQRLFHRASLIFTGGQSLYEAKKDWHPDVTAFPSSVDAAHFAQARERRGKDALEPDDQKSIAHPRAGFFGVIDERLDINLLEQVADLRPGMQFVIIGPVVKIDPADLPQRENIHYLGGKQYKELPSYLAGWDIAMMPFAINESTEFISPTKTPEYLAAGCPVVSTPIRDVVRPYQALGLVRIASTAQEFAAALDAALQENASERLTKADEFLASNSWDMTWQRMRDKIDGAVAANEKQSDAASSKAGDAAGLIGIIDRPEGARTNAPAAALNS